MAKETVETLYDNWACYAAGSRNDYSLAGYQPSTGNRVLRYKIDIDYRGASYIKFVLGKVSHWSGSLKMPLLWYITTDKDSHKNAGYYTGGSSFGTVTFNSGYTQITCEANYNFLPNTTYYFWVFPSAVYESTYSVNREPANNKLTLDYGAAGLVHIDNGSAMESFQCYVDNGTGWDLCAPHVDNGVSFDLCN